MDHRDDLKVMALSVSARTPVDAFLHWMQVEAGASPRTLEAYQRDLRGLIGFLKRRGIQDPNAASPEDIEAWARWLAKRGLAATTRRRHMAAARSFYKHQRAEGRLSNDPLRRLDPPKRPQRLPRVATAKEVAAMLRAAAEGSMPVRDVALLEVLYGTGIRASEAAGLRLRDQIPAKRALRVMGKGRKERIVLLGQPAVRALDAWLQERAIRVSGKDEGRLFLSRTGRPMDRKALWKRLRILADAAGVRTMHPHRLRHAFATDLLRGGADLRVIQELLGHARLETTRIYTHLASSKLAETIAQHHPRA